MSNRQAPITALDASHQQQQSQPQQHLNHQQQVAPANQPHQIIPHQMQHQKPHHPPPTAADFFPKHLATDLSDFAKKDAYNFVASPNLLQSTVHQTQQHQHYRQHQQMIDHQQTAKPSNNYNSQMHNFTGNAAMYGNNGAHSSGPNSGNYHREQFNITENPNIMSGRDNYNIRENYVEQQQQRNNQFNNNNYAMRGGEAEPLLTSTAAGQSIARVSSNYNTHFECYPIDLIYSRSFRDQQIYPNTSHHATPVHRPASFYNNNNTHSAAYPQPPRPTGRRPQSPPRNPRRTNPPYSRKRT